MTLDGIDDTTTAAADPPQYVIETERPWGIYLLGVLSLISAPLLAVVIFIGFVLYDAGMEQGIQAIGSSSTEILVSMVFLAALAFVMGLGLLKGAKWGWWCGIIYFLHRILGNGSGIFTIYDMSDQFEDSSRSPEYYYFKFGLRIMINILFFAYFFKGNVLSFFSIGKTSKRVAVGLLITVAVLLGFAALGTFLPDAGQ